MSRVSPLVRLAVPVILSNAALAGCDQARNLFTAHPEVAAEAAGRELSTARLSDIMSSVKSVKLNRDGAEMVASVWVDYSLLAQSIVLGQTPTDSASVAEAVWPEVAEILGSRWHDTLMARRSKIPPTAADSIYQKSDERLFQHILFGARENAPDTLRASKRKQAEAALTRIRQGAKFGGLAARLSEDPGSRADSGFLPLGPKGRFVAAFDSAAWLLGPGQTSGLVTTQYGYHILHRPSLDEVRARLNTHLVNQLGAHLDSIYMDSLATANKLEVVSDAPALMRTAIKNPGTGVGEAKPLARYANGALTTKDFLRWVNALPPQFSARVQTADDASLKQFAKALGENALLLRDAEAGGTKLTADEWADMTSRYKAHFDTLRAEMGLDSPELTDKSVPEAQREALAGDKVEAYLNRLNDGKTRIRPLPFALATVLRARMPFKLLDPGLQRSTDLALERARERGDTTRGQALPPGLRPAPGPAPIPGQQPDSAARQPAPAPADPAQKQP